MKQKQINDELLRLAIIILLIVCIFGVLQYYPEGKTFDSIGLGVVLKVVASTMLYAPFPIFAIYLILLGLNSRYEKKRVYLKLQSFFYDLGIFLTVFIIILVTLFSSLIWILVKFPLFPMELVIVIIWAFIIISAILVYLSIKNRFKETKKIG
ncbi:MAG: hypothetical protein V1788_02975 [Nanoarchaeota archaeon]